jgi:hypothetical protein
LRSHHAGYFWRLRVEFPEGRAAFIPAIQQKYDLFVLFPINQSTLAKYREAFKPSRAKDDPTDAELALGLLLRHLERFAPLRPQSVAMRSLFSLVEQRRELVGDKTRFINRLCDTPSSITRRLSSGSSREIRCSSATSSPAGRRS